MQKKSHLITSSVEFRDTLVAPQPQQRQEFLWNLAKRSGCYQRASGDNNKTQISAENVCCFSSDNVRAALSQVFFLTNEFSRALLLYLLEAPCRK